VAAIGIGCLPISSALASIHGGGGGSHISGGHVSFGHALGGGSSHFSGGHVNSRITGSSHFTGSSNVQIHSSIGLLLLLHLLVTVASINLDTFLTIFAWVILICYLIARWPTKP
jgi:hypothetical protein